MAPATGAAKASRISAGLIPHLVRARRKLRRRRDRRDAHADADARRPEHRAARHAQVMAQVDLARREFGQLLTLTFTKAAAAEA